jgi:ATP-dependent Lon protease
LKEKLLAARRGGIGTVIIPHENERDLQEVPDNIKENLDIRPVKWIDEVLAIALEHPPEPLDDEAYLDGSAAMGKSEEADSESVGDNRPRSH